MKITVLIQYDSETRTGTITLGDRPATVWNDCNFELSKELTETVVDGWTIPADNRRRQLVLEGVAP